MLIANVLPGRVFARSRYTGVMNLRRQSASCTAPSPEKRQRNRSLSRAGTTHKQSQRWAGQSLRREVRGQIDREVRRDKCINVGVTGHTSILGKRVATPSGSDKLRLMTARENITGRLCRTPEEVEKAEREFLDKLTPEDRIELTWQLTQAQWEGKHSNVSRLSRHHTRVIKR
jgi:hypothetical protein